ncbi:MAG TPA: bifunctional phosphoribosylaminoimidazolecarboxamide formyltransferase/IMP cyclohydrolase [Gaiellaceae bacterium]
MRALLSVYDKTGIESFAAGLVDLGWEITSSGGTARRLAEDGIVVIPVEVVTGAAEMLGHRVVTLHPNVHAGILARRDVPEDMLELGQYGIEAIDLVCVNLYPFSSVAGRHGISDLEAVEMIDVGGPAMLRAAAKNFEHVIAICKPEQYEVVLDELRTQGSVSRELRRSLANEAFATTASYDASIANWFGETEEFPEQLTLAFQKHMDLRYGENPHQRAAYYSEIGARRHLLSNVDQLGGKELSYNNLADLEGARRVARQFSDPAAVLVKHANPCGVACAETIEDAYERALAADPVSAYGCVMILNRPVSAALGARVAENFVEVIEAPGYDEGSLDALTEKEALRILLERERRSDTPGELDYKRVLGGLLVQERDAQFGKPDTLSTPVGSPSDEQLEDLLFAWQVCRHVTSNAIVIAKERQTIGIGAGQMSRVDAVKIALEKAREHGHDVQGSVLASDAFFPFADGPQLALEAGVAAIIQPGGSRRDDEVVAAVEAAGAAMLFTERRHFRH